MKFCKNCGQQSNEGAAFCTNCGVTFQAEADTKPERQTQSVSEAPSIEENSSQTIKAETKPAPPPVPRKPMGKMQKALLSFIGIFVLACIIAHLVVSNLYDPVKKIEAMNTAYNDKDKEAFFNAFHFNEGTVANAKDFYATVNEYGWTRLRNNLSEEIGKIKNKEHMDIIYNDEGEFISIHKKPIFFGLYNDIQFNVIPIEVKVWAPYENMTFRFGDKEVVSKEKDEEIVIGNFIPGTYEWSYAYDGIMPLSGKGTYSPYYNSENIAFINVDWDFTSITIDSDLADAIVYVGGKSTGKKVSELESLYPAQVNPAIEVFAMAKDKDGNEVKSEVIALDDEYIYLPFEYFRQEQRLAEQEQEIRDTYKRFRSDYETAIYYANFNYIEDYFKDGSKIKKDYAKFVTDHHEIAGYYYEFILNDITDFKVISDNEFELQTFETFNFSSEADGNLHYERKKKYSFSYIDDEIYIDEIVDLDTKKTKK
ncbi:TcaA NTF2-like domain-containing protein [Sporosarcina koreensis]|uniref:Zinc-ribbon domain-containing protein n=1 Tax=Sporosarcina koreensis TaxID=334735 RepID=A0ABW0TZA3_9BACL